MHRIVECLNTKRKNKETLAMDKEMSERFVIKLHINNLVYSITIRRDKEEIYRKAERIINEKLNLYKARFPGQNEERYTFMTMLDLVTKLVVSEQRNDTQPYLDKLDKWTAEIEETLAE